MDGELALEFLSRLLDIDSPRLNLVVMPFLRIIQMSRREEEIYILDFPLNASPPPDGLSWRPGHTC